VRGAIAGHAGKAHDVMSRNHRAPSQSDLRLAVADMAPSSAECPLLGEERKTFGQLEFFRF